MKNGRIKAHNALILTENVLLNLMAEYQMGFAS